MEEKWNWKSSLSLNISTVRLKFKIYIFFENKGITHRQLTDSTQHYKIPHIKSQEWNVYRRLRCCIVKILTQ